MKSKKWKWIRIFFQLLVLLGTVAFGLLIGSHVFSPEYPEYYDYEQEMWVGSPYISETLKLDRSKLLTALNQPAKQPYTKLNLFDTEITERVHRFIVRYNEEGEYETENVDKLRDLKNEVEALLSIVYRHIQGFKGRALVRLDKNHYLTLYRLRDMDRKITRRLLASGDDTETFFQRPARVPSGKGRWVLRIQEPETPDLNRYYDMVTQEDSFPLIVDRINELFLLDQEHFVTFLEHDETEIPVYDQTTDSINISYEQIAYIEQIFHAELKPESEVRDQIMRITAMVLLREFGHSFHEIFSIPYAGKMEDTVDQLAVILTAEVFGYDWSTIQKTVMPYAKALYRIHEIRKQDEEVQSSEQGLLIFNDTYDHSLRLGKQRFYSILDMLVGYRADLFSLYTVLNEYDYLIDKIYPTASIRSPNNYLRASNYWYNSVEPYFNYPEEDNDES